LSAGAPTWPRPRVVELPERVAAAVGAAFGLGAVEDVALAARGWVSLNVLWRFDTAGGAFAVKEVTRDSPAALEAAAVVEEGAARAGVDLPPLVRTADGGAVTATVEGRVFRCHRFVEGGVVPTASLRAEDARAAGAALGRVHAAHLPPDEVRPSPPRRWGRAHWEALLARGADAGAPWVDALAAAVPAVLDAETEAAAWAAIPRRWIGGHNDLRPDNALRVDDRLLLVDWDSAGPAVAGREVAGALRWWAPFEDELVAGYADVAGRPDLDEGAGEDGTLVWWLELNVRAALAAPGDEERAWAVAALAAGFGGATP
jgi:Ser/Thr protein kinase RdoA (MazF antagonist)